MDKQAEKVMDKWLFHAYKSGDLRVPSVGQPAATKETEKHAHEIDGDE